MGLLDILNGMQNGPRGPADPQDKSGGMSKFTMAILALLAWKAYRHMTSGQQPAPASQPRPAPAPAPAESGGGWGDFLKGGLGGLVLGGAAGSVLSGGLGDLLRQLQHHGLGDAADSWVGRGPNQQIGPNDLASALGADQIDMMTRQTGMSRDELLDGLSRYLPDVVDQLTPDGRLPTDDEASRWI